MGDKTGIEWTEATWNPTTGCDRVSPGCDHCYALTLAARLKAMGAKAYQADGDPRTSGPGFKLALHPDRLDQPLRWTKPRKIFVNSMSDLFHKDVTDEFIARVWAVMALAPQHTFQVLTKRHGRMRSLLTQWTEQRHAFRLDWFDEIIADVARSHYGDQGWELTYSWPLPNVWLGVSVEDQQRADLRIPAMLQTPAAVRFLSCEPLLGPVDLHRFVDPERECRCMVPAMDGAGQHSASCPCLTQAGIGWVIAGGESGRGHRPLDLDWVRTLRDQCAAAGVAFLFKQVGGATPKAGGRELDGRTHDDYPQAVTP